MVKPNVKNILVYAGIIVFFLALSYAFAPQVLDGKVVNQSDISSFMGMSREASVFNSQNPDNKTYWSNSQFGGMPTFAVIGNFDGDATNGMYKLLMSTLSRPVCWLFAALLGAFLLLLSMGISPLLAVGGAVAMAFCAYNFQIIQVGHNTKMQAIALFPYVLAGVIYTYRSALSQKDKWLPRTVLGTVLFALALDFQIKANHVQITYYLAIVVLVFAAALFIHLLASKQKEKLGRFFISSALMLVVGIIGIATNANKLIPLYEYTPYTMRGGSELTSENGGAASKGLDLDYATAWSYGIDEMPNLLIPNFNGGSSAGSLSEDSQMGKLLKSAGYKGKDLKNTLGALPLYWGPQPFTAGPMYMGAISLFLCLLGLFLARGKDSWWKWALVAAGVISVFLAWGNHFMWFTKLWFNYVPMYNKFRTVSMALVSLQVLVPLMGFYALDRTLKGEYDRKSFTKCGWTAWALTGGFCLLCIIFPGIAGTFTGASDEGMQDVIVEALVADRISLMRADALRSLIYVSLAFGLIFWAVSRKDISKVAVKVAALICVLVILDMFSAGKRYLSSEDFMPAKAFNGQFKERPADTYILADEALDFRVLDLSVNSFNDAYPSYFHKNIGGYSPVKMQRYQDLIDRYIQKEMLSVSAAMKGKESLAQMEDAIPYLPVLSMLNDKYLIVSGDYPPLENRYAQGPAWFVDKVVAAGSPDEEIALLGDVNLHTDAVIGEDFAWAREKVAEGAQSDTLYMTSYAPNELHYHYCAASDRAAVFSEVYYEDGWKLTLDGQEIPLFRTDWILRGAILPAGEGDLVMSFAPQCISRGRAISNASSIILIVLLVLSIALIIINNRNNGKE